jgi:hypothetical protein
VSLSFNQSLKGDWKNLARKKSKGTELSVFKGREARLNRAILQIVTAKSPLTIWDIKKQVVARRGFKQTRYHNINTRVKALESQIYLRKIGERETKAGGKAALYEATARAYFALLVGGLHLDDLINQLDEIETMTIVSLIVSRKLIAAL